MPATTIYSQGDVLLVDFPFSNGLGRKQRPSVVISGRWYNVNHDDYICAAITSSIPTTVAPDHIHLRGKEIQETGLAKESIIRVGSIFTISHDNILRRLGRVNGSTLNVLHERLKHVLDLA